MSAKATSQSGIRKHQQTIHQGVTYSCGQCLRRHQKDINEGVTYSCNQCEYKTNDSHIMEHTNKINMKGRLSNIPSKTDECHVRC